MAAALWEFWNVRGHLSEGLQWLREILDWEEAREPTTWRANALNGAGVMAVTEGDLAAARRFLEESLAIWRALGSDEVVHALSSLGYLASGEGDVAAEQAYYEEALRVARSAGNRRFTLYPLRGLGRLAYQRRNLMQAQTYLEESVAVARAFDDHKGLLWSLAALADTRSALGNAEAANAMRNESAAVAAHIHDFRGLLGTLPQMAHQAMLRGEYEQARALYGQCLKAAQEVEDMAGVGRGHFDLAVVAQYEDDCEQARRLFDEALRFIRQTKDEYMLAAAASQIAWHAWWRGDIDDASLRSTQEELLPRLQPIGQYNVRVWSQCYLAWAAHAQGDDGLANMLFQDILSAPASDRSQELVVWCLEGLARVWVAQAQMERAARLFGACEAVRRFAGLVLPRKVREEQEQFMESVRAALGEAAFHSRFSDGLGMTPEQALAYALEEPVA
jgi:tetratricopeptide (TPR) repeat protein